MAWKGSATSADRDRARARAQFVRVWEKVGGAKKSSFLGQRVVEGRGSRLAPGKSLLAGCVYRGTSEAGDEIRGPKGDRRRRERKSQRCSEETHWMTGLICGMAPRPFVCFTFPARPRHGFQLGPPSPLTVA
ncbi:hypothetical protein KM043_000851 [Ampulex compressa]|nr:hypothetical protein KM043_000851 [Ampulex compressa]